MEANVSKAILKVDGVQGCFSESTDGIGSVDMSDDVSPLQVVEAVEEESCSN